MSEKYENLFAGVYGWSVEDGKCAPPRYEFPEAVRERMAYFWDMAEDGLTLMGAMKFIFSEVEPDDYSLGASKNWLPMSQEFKDWVGSLQSMAEAVVVVHLLYGGKVEYVVTNGGKYFKEFVFEYTPEREVTAKATTIKRFARKFATRFEAQRVADEIGNGFYVEVLE